MPDASSPARAILIADDDPGVCKFIKDCLKSRGMSASEAPDGVTACEQAEASPPALVLLDVLLPKRDGYAVLLHLRASEATRHVPVILMSGEADSEQAGIARTLGAHAFLPKPFTASILLATVVDALEPEGR
jgi:DNA-binding response OmpR family regulator